MATGTPVDMGGNDLIINQLYTGAATPGASGTLQSAANLAALSGVTPGTATASKAVVLDSSKGIATITSGTITTLTSTLVNTPAVTSLTNLALNGTGTGTIAIGNVSTGAVTITPALTVAGVATFNANPTFGTGNTIKLGSGTATLTSNIATVTTYAGQFTTAALTTAAGASQALVITLTGASATDLAFITPAGGTNTRKNYNYEAVMTSNTCTVTLYNTEPTNAINGTLIFNLWILKA